MKTSDIHLGEVYSNGKEERMPVASDCHGLRVTWFAWTGAIVGEPQTSTIVAFAAWARARLVPGQEAVRAEKGQVRGDR